ncbi:MAG: A/G-specific adenine glycosylase [Minwuia sp.]|uniref:A/G-specific adenine glycosylase n=1 Tax=Minwuia sp. TaxID=2493630 RepID=UPI003A8964D9
MPTIERDRIVADLLAHYDIHRRVLPWRALPGETPDPYRVWLSEIMLQQTTVATVGPYFRAFTERWPTVEALAAADQDEVMHAWQGLGYYSRARNLLKCAKTVVAEHGGRFPETEAGLLELPGIGPYTAAAIAAIAFDRPAMPVDGNIERVTARLFAIEAEMPGSKPELRRLAATLTPERRPGDFAQALMDLGATICTPKSPACTRCPLGPHCEAAAKGIAAQLPRRAPKKAKPTRHAVFFWLVRDDGAVLFQRRPDEGLLGGMVMPPSTPWREEGPWDEGEALSHVPAHTEWRELNGTVRHGFTHFHFDMTVWTGQAVGGGPDGVWARPDEFGALALPTVAKKLCRHALDGGTLL